MTEEQLPEFSMDSQALYREEMFTDRQTGSIRRLVPVNSDGSDDSSRDIVYSGQTQVLTPAGALPLSFEIEASSLQEAAEKFADGAKAAFEKTLEELREMRRQASSSIVVPGMGGPGGAPGGGAPGGGGIQIP